MYKSKFTVVTQLHVASNQHLNEYIEFSRKSYSKAVRETFHTIKKSKDFNKSSFNTYLQKSYNISKRTAGSVISDAQSRVSCLIWFKNY